MKLPLSWLDDYLDMSGISAKEYSDALTMSGSKTEGFEQLGDEFENVVVGKILTKEKHENADTLWVCSVDVGEDIRQIVTGAQNIEVGCLVPIAAAPARLPGDVVIKKGKLRGVESLGMMCSHQELGVDKEDYPGASEHGIMILDGDYAPGTDIKKVLGLDDTIVEFEITSNRPDCLGVIGIARETAATFGREFKLNKPVVRGGGGNINEKIKISVKAPDLCQRYTAKAVKDIKIEPSPRWLRDRLTACGVRPINNIVDITNYVMLEYNQPMHAFDRSFLQGGEIVVRRAEDGEEIVTLDGVEHKLSSDILVIADSQRAVAVAGVMGGENSEITENTKEIIFESAKFNAISVRRAAKALGLRTEASARFEKNLDANNTLPAVERACELIELLGAGTVLDGVIDVYPETEKGTSLFLDVDRINKFLGTAISHDFMVKALLSLEFEVNEETGEIKAPTFRKDIESFADVAEEIARIYGYDKIQSTLSSGEAAIGGISSEKLTEERISEILTDTGYYEIITYSFTHPKSLSMLGRSDELEKCIKITNPLGEENSIMRNNMVHSIAEILAGNFKHRNKNARVFEIGKVYLAKELPLEKLPKEPKKLVLGGYGDMDFFSLKGAIENVFNALGIENYEFVAESDNPTFHPGKTAKILISGSAVGIAGELHPDVAEKYEVDKPMYIGEIDLSAIIKAAPTEKRYKAINRYPAVSRDMAILVDDNISAGDVEKIIIKNAGKYFEELTLFDVYKGKQLPANKKSLAYSITFRASDRTLNENDISKITEKIINRLQVEIGAEQR